MDIVSIYEIFPTEDDCLAHIERVRWPIGPRCPYCKSFKHSALPKEKRYHCNNCNTTYSVTIGTIFHHTHLPLQKWFLALSLILNAKKGLSARQLARDIHVNKDTAWRISMKIREAMSQKLQRNLLAGIVEMDETYVGGKPRRGGPRGSSGSKHGRGTKKTPVIGMVERGGDVKAKVAPRRKVTGKTLRSLVRRNVDIENTTLVTDEWKGYMAIGRFMNHKVINHSMWYVDGDIHTNTIECFWALLKRGIIGQYHKVSLKHLPKYIDEFAYRFNRRNSVDAWAETIERGLGVMS